MPQATAPRSPVPAGETLRHFVAHPAVRVELAAAEPQVVDPVAIRFDEDGRMWVVEMRDYPHGPAKGRPPQSRIKILEDRDNDGRFEHARVFADELLFATGLQPWKGGVIVTLAGEVAWMKDTDGDGAADLRETWFTGFAEENPQLRANHPTFALDNHIYIANGLRGGDVVARKPEWAGGAEPVSISGMDFRFDSLRGNYEAVSGVGQFGLTFDDWGNRFVCSNRNPCRHIVLEDRYIRRNPLYAVSEIAHDVSPAGEASRVFPISRAWTTSTLHAGQFTAACGVTIYRGDLLPEEFRGNSFTCEPTGNLVHRDILKPLGATFTSKPGREGVEFLATRDEWFRPVNLANGPDGALYVVDMHRAVIEHPQFMPAELKDRPDLRLGDDRGRIYRIVPVGQVSNLPQQRENNQARSRPAPHPNLSKLPTDKLVKLLEHPNAWHRETAARLIYERQDQRVQKDLEHLVRRGRTPQSRIHALWALQGLGVLAADSRSDPDAGSVRIAAAEVLAAALDDASPRVREHAVQLLEERLPRDLTLQNRMIEIYAAGDDRLRFQVALSLGEVDRSLFLGRIAGENAERPWIVRAALTSPSIASVWQAVCISALARAGKGVRRHFAHLRPLHSTRSQAELGNKQGTKWGLTPFLPVIEDIAELAAGRLDDASVLDAVRLALAIDTSSGQWSIDPRTAQRFQIAYLSGLSRGLRRRRLTLGGFVQSESRQLADRLRGLAGQIAETAGSTEAGLDDRIAAIQALPLVDTDGAGPRLLSLVTSETNQRIRLAAIEALRSSPGKEIGPALLQGIKQETPAVRRAILDVMLARTDRTRQLLEAIEAGRIAVTDLDAARVERLTRHRDAGIRGRARRLLAAAIPEDRRKVLAEYRTALKLKADPRRGRVVFEKNCATCHRVAGIGVNVAPDIADSRTKTPEQLLESILDPNRGIDNNYISYTAVTTDGQVHTGVISTETATSITLRQAEGKTLTLLRGDIDVLRSNGVSLMPVGLEKNVTVQEMADLISFIKNWRYLDGRVPIEIGH